MILEDGKANRELNSSQNRIACNIAQIKFNSVKKAGKVTTTTSGTPGTMSQQYKLSLPLT